MSDPIFYGGQAVVEGVMMRGARHYAVAVRDPRGKVVVHGEPLSPAYASRWARLPLIRGAVALWDTLELGMRSLAFAAEVALDDQHSETSDAGGGSTPILGSMIVALALAIAVFFVVPVLIVNAADRYISTALLSNLVEKVIRLGMILGYMFAIGRVPEVQRVFGYHGAEHKTVNAHEAGVALTVPNVRGFTLIHPRCGTTFLLVVVIVSFLVFSLLGRPPLVERIVSRIVLLPIVAGLAFELIRLGALNYHRRFVRTLLAPGLLVQRLTTREPDDSMIEVAIIALEKVLADEVGLVNGQRDPVSSPIRDSG